MLPQVRTVVSRKQFDALFDSEARIAEFSSPAEETAYEKRDSFLIHLIKQCVVEHFGTDPDCVPAILEDWWPNHTRYVEMTPLQCTDQFLEALHNLLTDEFAEYRIQICVYDETYVEWLWKRASITV